PPPLRRRRRRRARTRGGAVRRSRDGDSGRAGTAFRSASRATPQPPPPRARPPHVAAGALRRLERGHVPLVARPQAGSDLSALLRAPVRPAGGLARAPPVAARLGDDALRAARG